MKAAHDEIRRKAFAFSCIIGISRSWEGAGFEDGGSAFLQTFDETTTFMTTPMSILTAIPEPNFKTLDSSPGWITPPLHTIFPSDSGRSVSAAARL